MGQVSERPLSRAWTLEADPRAMDDSQRGRMATLQVETLQEEWPSSRLMKVRQGTRPFSPASQRLNPAFVHLSSPNRHAHTAR